MERYSVPLAWLLVFVGGCGDPELDARFGDTAAQGLTEKSVPSAMDLAPEGYVLAASGTHVEECPGKQCPTMWAQSPSPSTCAGSGNLPIEAYIIHQRPTDWNGNEGESELHGQTYELNTRFTPPDQTPPGTFVPLVDQSAIVQCCPTATGVVIAMKVCPDPCDSPDGVCPITLASGPNTQKFGMCKTTSGPWQLAAPHCDLQVIEAGWIDPHAPHDLDDPSGEDKRVFNVVYAPWVCGDGSCDPGEEEACDDDCA